METGIKIESINLLGMELEQWTHKSCIAKIGQGEDWATIFSIESQEKNKGHGTQLLIAMKSYYENKGKIFGSSVALSEAMSHLLKKLNIKEYN